jgi:3-hydroxyisobutyrate dehydrogenase-like beta-hydroxyacid dehydrogenase
MLITSLIGFGEAGQAFGADSRLRAFDIDKSKSRSASLAEALSGAEVVISVVTADTSLDVAVEAASHLSAGAYYFDMNSVAPDTKREAARVIQAARGHYVDVAIMSPVLPARLNVPLLLSGPTAAAGSDILTGLGFKNVRAIEGDIGRASAIKMIRSVMIKGQEALTAEMMLAADKAGVVDEVLASLEDGWAEKVSYNLERMQTHGLRRAAEMEEVAKTLVALGVDPLMTSGTIRRQREMAA